MKFNLKYKVEGYFTEGMCHILRDEFGKRSHVDIMVNGDLPELSYPELLIGKTVEIAELVPSVYIGSGVKLVVE